MKWSLRGIALLFGLVVFGACQVGPAETFTVNTTLDTNDASPGDGQCADSAQGACSLRAAVQEANANPNISAITLAGGQTYNLSLGPLEITQPAYIAPTEGSGQATINGAGNPSGSVLEFNQNVAGGLYTLTNLNVTGGVESGVSVVPTVETFELRVSNTRVHNNTINGIRVGASILTIGKVKVSNSTIDANNVGVVLSTFDGDVELFQTTVANNLTGQVRAFDSFGSTIESSTITGNGNGLQLGDAGLTVTNSVIDTTGSACAFNPPSSGGGNVVSDSSCNLGGTGDLEASSGNLKPLDDNGGPVPTQLVSLFSDANNSRPCGSSPTVDARGEQRPATTDCDAGATESQPGEATGIDCTSPPVIGPNARLANCDFPNAFFDGLNLSGVDLRFADLDQTSFFGTDLSTARLDSTYLFNAELSEADLTFAEFDNAILTEATLDGADVSFASFIDTDLTNANLTNTQLVSTDFTNADLTGANLSGTLDISAVWSNTTCSDGTNSDDPGNFGSCT